MKKITRITAVVMAAATMTVTASVCASAASEDSAYDSHFPKDIGAAPDRFGELYTEFHWFKVTKMVDQAWAKLGIRSVCNYLGSNQYCRNGAEIPRWEAYDHAAYKLDKTYDYMKYSGIHK